MLEAGPESPADWDPSTGNGSFGIQKPPFLRVERKAHEYGRKREGRGGHGDCPCGSSQVPYEGMAEYELRILGIEAI